MKIVAAGSFTSPPALEHLVGGIETIVYDDAQYLMLDTGHPRGCKPFNIASVKKNPSDGSYEVRFTVSTAREGTQKYRWFVFNSYGLNRARVDWVTPTVSKLFFYDTGGNVGDPVWWTLVVVRDVPDGTGLNEWTVLQTFAADGSLIPTPPDLLPGSTPRGVQAPVPPNPVGFYNLFTVSDVPVACAANLVIYEPVAGELVNCVLTGQGARQLILLFDQDGVPANVGPWTLASYNFKSEVEEPTSIEIVNRYASNAAFNIYADNRATMATGVFSLTGSYYEYAYPAAVFDVWASGYPTLPGRSPFSAKLTIPGNQASGAGVFTSSNPLVATIENSSRGEVRLLTPGTTDIQATLNGMTSNVITITVVP